MLQYTLSLILFLVSLFFLWLSVQKKSTSIRTYSIFQLLCWTYLETEVIFFVVFYTLALFFSGPTDHFHFAIDFRKRTKSVSRIRIHTNGFVLGFDGTILDFCGRRNKTKTIKPKRNKTDQILGIGFSVFYTFDDKKFSSPLYPIFTFYPFKRVLDFVIRLANDT